MMVRDRGGPKLACQIIVTAMLDVACNSLVQPLSRQNFFYLVPLLLLLSSLLKLLRDRLVIDLHGFLILQ